MSCPTPGSARLAVHTVLPDATTQGPSSTDHKYNPPSSLPVCTDLVVSEHLQQDAPVSLTFSQFHMKY